MNKRELKQQRKLKIKEYVLKKKRELNKFSVEFRNKLGRTSLRTMKGLFLDVRHQEAVKAYRENLDGCATLWRLRYRRVNGPPSRLTYLD